VPEYKQGEPEALDPVLAAPLREQGLLHYLIADQVVDKAATEQLATALTNFITSGAFDSLARDGTAFHAISMSRMGYFGDQGLAQMLFEELEARGLARKSQDGVSIPLHPAIRYLILVLLAQILRPRGASMGLDLSPATDQPRIVKALTELLELPTAPSAGHVVAFDLETVSVDLSAVPLDEVLAVPSAPGAAASESGTLRHGDEGQGRGDRHWRQPKVGYAQYGLAVYQRDSASAGPRQTQW